ncbi:protein ANTAGONIST OF LIKE HETEROCHROMATIN PROTEIN 1-like [Leguminivora glycinivorella]|uniref:protein ANTAGONIST OF LIKE HETEROCHROMATIN PROTEIN 1-like n=1 Tax=Leguminivora glycinivorella TaxID=1035111 RepID=UPI00200D9C90|nr:protein ANTAGONIST OF LIKE HETEROCHROMATIN PROTEIN 1-like [Leguminivora glycinivorella]
MDSMSKKFITEMFLDSDSVTSINRLVIAVAKVVNENVENISTINDVIQKEYDQALLPIDTNQQKDVFGLSVPIRSKNFYEETIVNFNNDDYIEFFKMKKSTVEALVKLLNDLVKPGSIVPLDKKVHVFLWLLINSSSCSEVGLLFNLHKSTVNLIFHEIATLLTEQRYNFISWPSIEEQHLTRVKVNNRFNFPNCVGFIDACRLKVSSIRNKRSKPDIVLLQAVCDESLMFVDIHVSEIGRTRKGKVFRESKIAQELKNFVDFENHILGDSQYKLRKNLITPFSSEELLTSEEMKFNEVHWKARSYIGHAFEMLKERFRKLNHIDINRHETVKTLICASCVLHNFILLHEGCSDLKEETIACNDGVVIDTDIVKSAVEKRQFLCNYINYLEST